MPPARSENEARGVLPSFRPNVDAEPAISEPQPDRSPAWAGHRARSDLTVAARAQVAARGHAAAGQRSGGLGVHQVWPHSQHGHEQAADEPPGRSPSAHEARHV